MSSMAMASLSRLSLVRIALPRGASMACGARRSFGSIYKIPLDDRTKRWAPMLTKIVATIGPVSEQFEDMQPLVQKGMRIMRLNFSHATYEEADLRITNLRNCKGRSHVCGRQDNLRAVLLDTQGPEIRTGKLKDDVTGKGTVNFVKGNEVLLRTDHATRDAGSTAAVLYINYKDLARSIEIGSKVLLDDGAIALNVNAIDLTEGTVTCTVDNSGELRSRAGVNLPGGIITLPAMSVKDKEDIRYGLKADVDYIAPSFVRNAAGVHEIRSFIKSSLEEMGLSDRIPPMIISKIENTEALVNFDEILEASDGIMVARGDLGVEIPLQHVTNAQKAMVSACNAAGKPVIVATQMLETMTKNPRPTRAEVADVTNAVADGADCVMLSGETAKGSYAPQAVKTMGDIIKSTEDFIRSLPRVARPLPHSIGHDPKETVAMAAVAAAEQSGAKAIIVITKSGTTARLVAKYQPSMPILCFCPNYKIGRQLMITRGCHPYIGLRDFKRRERPAAAVAEAKAMNFLAPGDKYVMVTVQENVEEMGDFTTMHLGTAR